MEMFDLTSKNECDEILNKIRFIGFLKPGNNIY